MKIARAVSLLSALILCLAAFTACGKTGDGISAVSDVISDDAVSEAAPLGYGPADYGKYPYEDTDLRGSDPIKILCVDTERHTYGYQQFTYMSENEGGAINTEVAKRNNKLEELYGIRFEVVPAKNSSPSSPASEIAVYVESNLYEYDVICDSVDRLVVGTTRNYYTALDGYMDFSHPWWDAQAIESLAVSDSHFLLAGDAILTDDDNTYLTLFNKDMYAANAEVSRHGDIYQLVRDRKFTIDLYYEMCKAVSVPDSNGRWTFDATYGNLSHGYGATVMMNGCNVATVVKDSEGKLVLNVDALKSVSAFEKVYDLMSDAQNTELAERIIGQSPYVQSKYGFAELENMFVSGRGLFYNTTSSSVSILKRVRRDFEFGVLPIPLYDTDQEHYCNTVNRYQSSALAIPSNVPEDRVREAVLALQALGFYNGDVIRAYYLQTLQLQALVSDEDAEMLDIVYNNRFYDIGAIFGWGGSTNLENIYQSLIGDTSSNKLISLWESAKPSIESAMEKTLEAYNNSTN